MSTTSNTVDIPDPAVEYVENLEIDEPTFYTPPPDHSQRGYIVGGALVAFARNVDDVSKQDILNATLFAQLSANKKFNREEDMQNWYNFYTLVLKKLGFIIETLNFEQHEVTLSTFTMERIITETHNGSGDNTEEMKATLNAMMRALREKPNNDTTLSLFTELCSCSGNSGNFQVMPCQRGPDGRIFFLLGTYFYQANKHEDNILFSPWDSNTTTVYKSVQKVTFNQDAYRVVRHAVSFKLKDAASRLVESLCIDDSGCKV